jgi:hypothetical protein
MKMKHELKQEREELEMRRQELERHHPLSPDSDSGVELSPERKPRVYKPGRGIELISDLDDKDENILSEQQQSDVVYNVPKIDGIQENYSRPQYGYAVSMNGNDFRVHSRRSWDGRRPKSSSPELLSHRNRHHRGHQPTNSDNHSLSLGVTSHENHSSRQQHRPSSTSSRIVLVRQPRRTRATRIKAEMLR